MLSDIETDMEGITDDGKIGPEEDTTSSISITETGEESSGDRVIASPLARRMAQQQGIDLSLIKGSGPRGRIIKRDILEAVARLEKSNLYAENYCTYPLQTGYTGIHQT